jgi:phenylacetate-coenzyme A ligase PaaK-like adenylate-forming protein
MNAAYTFKRLIDVGRGLSLHRLLERHEHWTRAQILELQRQRLAALVRHAVSSSPFYRDWYGPRRPDADIALEELPVFTKATMMEGGAQETP